jgi:uncharacterized protein YoxC
VDLQVAFNVVAMAFMAVCGYVVKSIHLAVQQLADDMKKLEKELPATYARKDDLNLMLADIKGALIRIEEKLDGKVDR